MAPELLASSPPGQTSAGAVSDNHRAACDLSDALSRIAAEAEAEAARLAPAAEAAVAAARAAAVALRRLPDQMTLPHLRHLAADRMSAWLAAHPDARSFQASSAQCNASTH